jgi:hypothetical protein
MRLILVADIEFELTCLRHYDNGRLPDELIEWHGNAVAHHTVAPRTARVNPP